MYNHHLTLGVANHEALSFRTNADVAKLPHKRLSFRVRPCFCVICIHLFQSYLPKHVTFPMTSYEEMPFSFHVVGLPGHLKLFFFPRVASASSSNSKQDWLNSQCLGTCPPKRRNAVLSLAMWQLRFQPVHKRL